MYMLVPEHRGGTVRVTPGKEQEIKMKVTFEPGFRKTGGTVLVSVLGEMEAIRAKSELLEEPGGAHGVFEAFTCCQQRAQGGEGSLDKKGSGGPQVRPTKANWPDE